MIPCTLLADLIDCPGGKLFGDRFAGISAIGIDRPVIFIQKGNKLLTVMDTGRRNGILRNQLAVCIRFYMILKT